MEVMPLAFTAGWASGLNAYVTVLTLGLLGRFVGVDGVPEALQRTDVLIVATVLTLLEGVIDKVPHLDSVWDGLSTILRPVVGATLGVLLVRPADDLMTITIALVGGLTALLAHLVKTALRLILDTSPRPSRTAAVSLAEDAAVVGILLLAWLVPLLAAVLAGATLLVGVLAMLNSRDRVREGWAAFHRWYAERTADAEMST